MNPYYIYALKDPRTSPARTFYVGKGTGNRAWEHTLRVDSTRKGQRISEIQESGFLVITTVLADELTEAQALKLEAELISAFGTEDSGGILTNSVIPSGMVRSKPKTTVVPSGVVEKAQVALELLKASVLELAQANPEGITNSVASKVLGLQSDYAGGSKDYLAWSILGLLMREGKMVRGDAKKHRVVVRRGDESLLSSPTYPQPPLADGCVPLADWGADPLFLGLNVKAFLPEASCWPSSLSWCSPRSSR